MYIGISVYVYEYAPKWFIKIDSSTSVYSAFFSLFSQHSFVELVDNVYILKYKLQSYLFNKAAFWVTLHNNSAKSVNIQLKKRNVRKYWYILILWYHVLWYLYWFSKTLYQFLINSLHAKINGNGSHFVFLTATVQEIWLWYSDCTKN